MLNDEPKGALISRMNAYARSHQTDAFEAACFYMTAGQRDRAVTRLHALQQRSPWVLAYERFDPRPPVHALKSIYHVPLAEPR
jgi:hypothetical protein